MATGRDIAFLSTICSTSLMAVPLPFGKKEGGAAGAGKLMSKIFNVGDMAVYPAHGVGKIEAIERRVMGTREQFFYVLKILDTNMVIMIPTDSIENVGLRTIIDPEEVGKVFDILRQEDVQIMPQPWNQRYRDYMDKIKTGSIYEIATVLRDLYLLREDKTLSFGERKMLDTARSLLVKEIAISRQKNEVEVEKSIEEIFA